MSKDKMLKGVKDWFYEPIDVLKKVECPELMWIPLFLLISIVPIIMENTINNLYVNNLYKFLIVFFSAYISNKIPYSINIFGRLHGKLLKFKPKSLAQQSEYSISSHDEYITLSCSQVRTWYSVFLFALSIYWLNRMQSPCDLRFFFIVIFILLITYRTILYILQPFLLNKETPSETMDHQIAIDIKNLTEKREVKIIK